MKSLRLIYALFFLPAFCLAQDPRTPASQLETARQNAAEAHTRAEHSDGLARTQRATADRLRASQRDLEKTAADKEKVAVDAKAANAPDAAAKDTEAKASRKLATDRAAEAADAEKQAIDREKTAAADLAAAEEANRRLVRLNHVALGNPAIYEKSLAALTMLFVIALLLENAFALVFNWRVFLAFVSLRGMKTVIMVLVSLLVVNAFEVDIVASLISVYKEHGGTPGLPVDSVGVSKFITALILAGGSVGVHRIMAGLGFRDPRREEVIVPKPPRDQAWIAVRVTRQNIHGAAKIKIKTVGVVSADAPEAAIAGTITFRRPSLRSILLPDPCRLPPNGGYTLVPGTVYEITIEGRDQGGNPLLVDASGASITQDHAPTKFVFAPGAIVDFEVVM